MAINKVKFGNTTVIDLSGDTVASAADIVSGKVGHLRDGSVVTGTASGGGGGASNIVHGTFTTGSTTGVAESHTIPYTGTGYPIAFLCWVKGGAYNNTSAGNTNWYNLVQRYAVGVWGGIKSRTTEAPTYASSGGNANNGTTFAIYKNSSSSATNYSGTRSMTATMYSTTSATSSATINIRFTSNTKISVFIASTSYGLPKATEFEYIALYSA